MNRLILILFGLGLGCLLLSPLTLVSHAMQIKQASYTRISPCNAGQMQCSHSCQSTNSPVSLNAYQAFTPLIKLFSLLLQFLLFTHLSTPPKKRLFRPPIISLMSF